MCWTGWTCYLLNIRTPLDRLTSEDPLQHFEFIWELWTQSFLHCNRDSFLRQNNLGVKKLGDGFNTLSIFLRVTKYLQLQPNSDKCKSNPWDLWLLWKWWHFPSPTISVSISICCVVDVKSSFRAKIKSSQSHGPVFYVASLLNGQHNEKKPQKDIITQRDQFHLNAVYLIDGESCGQCKTIWSPREPRVQCDEMKCTNLFESSWKTEKYRA